jgi:hypothetical protein
MEPAGESIVFVDDLDDEHFSKLYGMRNLYLSR